MPVTQDLACMEARREQILPEINAVGDLHPGILRSRHMQCGEPNCRRAEDNSPGPGPYCS